MFDFSVEFGFVGCDYGMLVNSQVGVCWEELIWRSLDVIHVGAYYFWDKF